MVFNILINLFEKLPTIHFKNMIDNYNIDTTPEVTLNGGYSYIELTFDKEYTIIESDYNGRSNNDCETIFVTDVKWLREK